MKTLFATKIKSLLGLKIKLSMFYISNNIKDMDYISTSISMFWVPRSSNMTTVTKYIIFAICISKMAANYAKIYSFRDISAHNSATYLSLYQLKYILLTTGL